MSKISIEPTPLEMEYIREVSRMMMDGLKEGSISLDEPSRTGLGCSKGTSSPINNETKLPSPQSLAVLRPKRRT